MNREWSTFDNKRREGIWLESTYEDKVSSLFCNHWESTHGAHFVGPGQRQIYKAWFRAR